MLSSNTEQTFFNKLHNAKKAFSKVAILSLVAQLPFQALAAWETVEDASISKSRVAAQRGVGLYTFNDVSLSGSPELTNELRLVIISSSHTVLTPDGIDENENPYFVLDSIDERQQVFFAMQRARFSYTAELQQFIPEEPSDITFTYDFNTDQIHTGNPRNNGEGWIFPTNNRGTMAFEAAEGEDGTAAYSFTDTSSNVNITQHGFRFNNRTNQPNINPWTDLLVNAETGTGLAGETLNSVSLWVRVEKAVPGNVTIRHTLMPYPLVDDTRGRTITAGRAVSPNYEMLIPAAENGNWVQIEFVDTNTGERSFTIPDSWTHFDGESSIQVYPEILLGGLAEGDKVYIDNYAINAEPIENPCCEAGSGGNTGGGSGGNTGGGNTGGSSATPKGNFTTAVASLSGATGADNTFAIGDNLTFTYNFDANEIATGQGAQGWIHSVNTRGTLGFENTGRNGAALSYTDIHQNINPEQTGTYLQDWNANPFTTAFDNNGHTIDSVKVWVKTELTTEKDVEIIHYLIPYGLEDGNKSVNYPAGVAASPRLVGTIPAGSTDWVEIDLVIEGTSGVDFVIPPTWYHATGDELQIYPEFKFGNTVEGDKIFLDDYQATTTVGEAAPIPTDFGIAYNFETATLSQSTGWGFISGGFGTVALEDGTGFDASKAISFTDTNDGAFIDNHSLIWHKFNATSPWNTELGGGNVASEIQSITLRVKVEKGAGNVGTDNVTIKHNLLPWNITLEGGKTGKVAAAQEVTPDFMATVNSADFGEWVEITFVNADNGSQLFTIPDLWQLTDGKDIIAVLPSFFFGGLETGDKVIIDDYVLVGDKANARPAISDAPAVDYGLHDGSGTFTNNGRPVPLVVNDADFYTAPLSHTLTRDVITDYAVDNSFDNTNVKDDTASLQTAFDDISTNGGGKLTIPAGDYYIRSLHARSNLHIEVDEGATFHLTQSGNSANAFMFEMGFLNQGKVDNFSLVGLGNGFTVDLSIERTSTSKTQNENIAVFRIGDIENFRIANINIEDNKTIFASFLVGVTERDNDLHWPVNGIIEDINQTNSLFGYGVAQTYAADNILFRNLHSQGGITLRMETDNLAMKRYDKGGIRNIFAENISGENCLAPVMFGPHFLENGSVQVNGVTSNSCSFAVRVDPGFVELISPSSYDRDTWQTEMNGTYTAACIDNIYQRESGWAARIAPTKACLDAVHQRTGLKPGWFAESFVYNVTANYGTNAHLKLENLYYIPSADDICVASTATQWPRLGQIFMGDSVAPVVNEQKAGVDYNFNINVNNITANGFPAGHYNLIDGDNVRVNPSITNFATAVAQPQCSDARWNYQPENLNF